MDVNKKLIALFLPLSLYSSVLTYIAIPEKKVVDAECYYKNNSNTPWKCYLDLNGDGCFDTLVYDHNEDGMIDEQENIEKICRKEKT
ncbi:MAG: hypothetical protein AB1571_01700 [Nanoarchaeota archaeon]